MFQVKIPRSSAQIQREHERDPAAGPQTMALEKFCRSQFGIIVVVGRSAAFGNVAASVGQ